MMPLGPIRCMTRARDAARGCSIDPRGGQVGLTPDARHLMEWLVVRSGSLTIVKRDERRRKVWSRMTLLTISAERCSGLSKSARVDGTRLIPTPRSHV